MRDRQNLVFETEAVSSSKHGIQPIKHFPRRENWRGQREKMGGKVDPPQNGTIKRRTSHPSARINKRGSSSRGQTRDIQVPAIN